MEMHMVHINSKYVGDDGTLDDSYATEADGVAVLGFMFEVNANGRVSYSYLAARHFTTNFKFKYLVKRMFKYLLIMSSRKLFFSYYSEI